MSFIVYPDRVNLSAAAGLIRDDLHVINTDLIRDDLHLTNTDVGLVFAV